MSVIASCGHTLTEDEDMGWTLTTQVYDREWQLCYRTGVYCRDCKERLEAAGEVVVDRWNDAWGIA